MELFRVGGDVPETNYLFMGEQDIVGCGHDAVLIAGCRRLCGQRVLQPGILPTSAVFKSAVPRPDNINKREP